MPERARQFRPRTTAPTVPTPERRGNRHERGYTAQWSKAAKAFLREHPLCVKCRERGRVEAATCVDHITPHKGDQTLFWDVTNWQSLCTVCHNRKSATE
jgi:5-methylcytosine-specific restriction protein A